MMKDDINILKWKIKVKRMANKGHKNRQKRISYNGRCQIKRKEFVWTFNQAPGPYAKNTGATLGSIIRDILHFADNSREIKYILTNKDCRVNGKRIKDEHFPLGLFDVLEFKDVDKRYRIFLNNKNKFVLKDLSKEKLFRPCRIVSKKIITGSNIQLGFDNGFSWILPKTVKANVGDTVEYNIEKAKFGEITKLQENAQVYVVGGPHVSKIGILKAIVKGDVTKANEITVESEGKTFKTREKYVFVIPNDLKL